ncbi:MAG TPA: LytTR family DNA-binding domain-containing protein [Hymenobacter sp.]|uniref:LytR/AlgR family response regulator transcription factor n=1 Tax=Hymenobacter sp. TaxID=1898978 RepID=UPI002D7F0D24|nr:LytTR family DNA-binding domain-containing protein [Hymenobacter sp.]HET9502910.1 LytTR family DNA-binding domain-containing protein [Hymenobacter sp.]
MPINCIAVDDEPLALALVCTFIEQTPFLNLVGRYGSGVEALQGLHELTEKVDVAFLDIQMQELTGLELARVLGQAGSPPRIIFTTAFPQYALESYKVDALDYLVKPFNYEEFLRAANKAKAYAELMQSHAEAAPIPAPEEDHIFLKVEYQLIRVALNDILYVEGLKDYVKVHLKSTPRALLSLMSLRSMEEKLPARRFMRIHRSFIVALDKIESVRRLTVQIGAETIPVGEQYKEAFGQFLSRWS